MLHCKINNDIKVKKKDHLFLYIQYIFDDYVISGKVVEVKINFLKIKHRPPTIINKYDNGAFPLFMDALYTILEEILFSHSNLESNKVENFLSRQSIANENKKSIYRK